MWDKLIIALGLVLIIEGVLPFLSPHSWKQTMLQITNMPDHILRVIGLSSMLIGLFILLIVN